MWALSSAAQAPVNDHLLPLLLVVPVADNLSYPFCAALLGGPCPSDDQWWQGWEAGLPHSTWKGIRALDTQAALPPAWQLHVSVPSPRCSQGTS